MSDFFPYQLITTLLYFQVINKYLDKGKHARLCDPTKLKWEPPILPAKASSANQMPPMDGAADKAMTC